MHRRSNAGQEGNAPEFHLKLNRDAQEKQLATANANVKMDLKAKKTHVHASVRIIVQVAVNQQEKVHAYVQAKPNMALTEFTLLDKST